MKLFKHLAWMLLAAGVATAQNAPPEGSDEANDRVQYTLILPDEKNPEVIKADENNPFETVMDKTVKEGDTEENRVRDILLSMPAKGGGNGMSGMRVMLGSMRLEAGQMVPNVLPDQQVKLQVKSITPTQIEMVWVEKKPTGLPPKPFVINVDVSPRVRYRMPSGAADGGSGGIGTLRMEGRSAFSRRADPEDKGTAAVSSAPAEPPPLKALAVEDEAPAQARQKEKEIKAQSASSPAQPSNVPEASVLRMLFGNHAQKPR
ncbi:hypothetical protein [Brevifollis gellanilyticus]|uniref:Uncharacterized protein n=1 Tax=Brevifollis gellanilyticus TaxID=748831 RepID=A0A512M3C4_9BACT|nr:hypothetical protein [Brevifollis gellanilyticus]GEP41245.1 hypothetical protein BGE01nite_05360 [Brevifollis gellanilyticus]